MLKAIVFDMDGVLFDTEGVAKACWNELKDAWNVPDVDGIYTRCIGKNLADNITMLQELWGPSVDVAGYLGACLELLHKKLAVEVPLKPGTREILAFLKERGVPLGICSGSASSTVISNLKNTGLTEYFQIILGGEEIPHGKPQPDCYRIACSKLGFQPSECLAVEDSPNGIRASHAAGLFTVMVPDMVQPNDELRSLSDRVDDSLFTLLEYLKTIF